MPLGFDAEFRVADADVIPGEERLLLHAHSVDPRAVGAPLVPDDPAVRGVADAGVAAGDARVVR